MAYGTGSNEVYNLKSASFSRHPGTGVRLLEVVLEDARASRTTYRFAASNGVFHSYWDGSRIHPASSSDFADAYRALDSAGFFGNKGLEQSVKQTRAEIRKRGREVGLVPAAEREEGSGPSIDAVVAQSVRPYLAGGRTVLADESPAQRAGFVRDALGLPRVR